MQRFCDFARDIFIAAFDTDSDGDFDSDDALFLLKVLAPLWIAAVILALLWGVHAALAHDRGDFLPCYPSCDTPTPTIQHVRERGYGIYDFDAATEGWDKAAQAVYGCLEDLYQRTSSQGQQGMLWFKRGSPWVPSAASPVDVVFVLGAYGNTGWAGQAVYANDPSRVEINLTAVASYNDLSSTYCHEFGHILLFEDQYFHPLTCDTQARWTVMSCGTLIGRLQDYDVGVVLNVFMPDLPSRVEGLRLDTQTVRITYNGLRASGIGCQRFSGSAQHRGGVGEKDNYCGHYSANLDNVTRVAVFRGVEPGVWELVAYGAPAKGSNLVSVTVPDAYGWFAIHPESALPMTWLGGVPFLSGSLAGVYVP